MLDLHLKQKLNTLGLQSWNRVLNLRTKNKGARMGGGEGVRDSAKGQRRSTNMATMGSMGKQSLDIAPFTTPTTAHRLVLQVR